MKQVFFEDVEIGFDLAPLVVEPTHIQLFRYSAITWNAHRIHYDKDFALRDGHPDIIVQAHLYGGWLLRLLTDWGGATGRVKKFGWSNRARAVPGDTITCQASVTGKRIEDGEHLIDLSMAAVHQTGVVCAPASATVALPSRRIAL